MLDDSATYSPDDNKLRLYPAARLDKETYNRVKAAGFKWAPKQELFVAPMWTPERADLLIELCGEIDDEDKSLAERAEERAERFEDYSDNRAQDAERARAAVSAIADNIPFGQPILVGHHSEKRARRDAEKIENGMRKAVKLWDQSEYWTHRAAGAIRHAKYKERPDVRARRIKTIEADKRKRERTKKEAENLLKFWEGKAIATNRTTGEKRPIEITEENRDFLRELLGRMPACGVQVQGKDGTGYFSAWDILKPEAERYKNCPERTVAELQQSAIRLQSAIIARADRWLEHYDNRLAYENAMMQEAGGLETDRVAPEVGGAVKCWVARGQWLKIEKVNKVSVTVLDSFNGTDFFPRTVPFDKLAEVMSRADFEALHAERDLYAREKREREEMEAAHMDKLDAVFSQPYAELARSDKDRARVKVALDLLDEEERKNPPAPMPLPEPEPAPAAVIEPPAPEAPRDPFEAMRATLKSGGVQVVSAPQLFPTPAPLAARVIELADIREGNAVLEPSAGTGALLKALPAGVPCVAVEINFQLAMMLQKNFKDRAKVNHSDFLAWQSEERFDRIVMNPPFERGSDIHHVERALKFLKPGGKLVAIVANGPRQRAKLEPLADEWIDLEPGAFAASGTNVNAAIVIFSDR